MQVGPANPDRSGLGIPGRAIIPTLALTAMFTMVNQASLGAFMPVISDDLDVSIPVLGQVTTGIFVGAAFISLIAGPLGDFSGKRRLLIFGLGVVTMSAFFTALAPSFGWFMAARLLSTISGGFMIGTLLATAGSLFQGDARRSALSWIMSGIASGSIVGLPALTYIASLASWRVSYFVISGMAFSWIFVLYAILPNDGIRREERFGLAAILNSYQPVLAQRSLLAFYAATLTRAIAWIGTLAYIGAFLGNELDLSTSEIGWAYMVGGSGYFIGTKLAGHQMIPLDLRPLCSIATAMMALMIGLSILLPLGPIGSIAFIAVAAVAGGLGWVALITLLSMESQAGQGTTMSLNSSVFQAGSALGGLFGGVLIAFGGFPALAAGLMGFGFVSALIVWNPLAIILAARPRVAGPQ